MSKVRSKQDRLTAEVADTEKKSAVKNSEAKVASQPRTTPRGWVNVTMREVSFLNPGLPVKLAPDSDVSFVPMAAASEEGQITSRLVRKFREVAKGYTPFVNGDVLWAKITPCMENGKSAIASDLANGTGFGSTEFFVLRSNGSILPEFLHRFIRQERFRRAARKTMNSAVGQARVPKSFLLSSPIPLPPLAEQRRIVARLEALEARSRRARALLAEVPAQLARARQSLLAAAFRGDLTADWRSRNKSRKNGSDLLDEARTAHRNYSERHKKTRWSGPVLVEPPSAISLPKTWAWIAGEEVVEPGAEVVYGIVQPGPKLEKGVPYVRGTDIQDGKILFDQLLKTSAEIANRYARSSLAAGDVLLGIIRATKVAVVPSELNGANITQGTARFRPSSVISTDYLAHVLASPETQSWLHAHYRGIDMPGLNLADVRRVPVPLPPLPEQHEIVRRLSAALTRLDAAARTHAAAVAELDRFDQSLLARAFSGTLVPQDPADEPAASAIAHLSATHDKRLGLATVGP